ncbi:MAG TPA: hypothetical protein PKE13_08255 [Hyphomicrobium zavarzinii]|nr:hypothetical protein [Hyphomicrobium zavarzinii]
MFMEQIAAAIGCARAPALDALAKAVAGACVEGQISEADFDVAFALIQARRDQFRQASAQLTFAGVPVTPGGDRPPLPRSRFPQPRYQPARSHPERIARRRQIAASGPMPPQLAAEFTTGQLAVLAIVADEAGAEGRCALCLDQIAARAGVCRTTARAALRLAEKAGLLTRTERRQPGRASLTTVLRIISPEWRLWIKHGGRRASKPRHDLFKELGVKKTSRTDRLRLSQYGQPLSAAPSGPSGGLRPPAKAGLGAARLT